MGKLKIVQSINQEMNTRLSLSLGEFEQAKQRIHREEMADEILIIAVFIFLVAGLLGTLLFVLGAVRI